MELSKETKFTLSTETMATLAIGLVGATGLYYTLKGDIEAAKELPKPAVTAEEYQLKDQLLRTTVDNIEKKVDKIDQRLEKIEERLMR